MSFVTQGLGTAILVGREEIGCAKRAAHAGIDLTAARASRSTTPACRSATPTYAHFLYERLQRQGYLLPRLPAPDQPGPQPSSPPAWWRSATPTPW